MKSLVLFLFILFSSCVGGKKAIQNSESKQYINKEVIITDSKNETIIKVETEETPTLKIEKTKNDSLPFHQKLSKRKGDLHDLFNNLLQKHVSIDGNVDYKGFKDDYKKLLDYITVLQKVYDFRDELNKEQKLAYWINAYNALTIDLIIRNYPLKSIKDIKNPWEQRFWKFGNTWLNLNDIEHNILRKLNEPRIHFAIVCAAKSCPKLYNKAFTASTLDADLTKLTKAFLADTTKNNISKEDVKLSKIFKWFEKDFKTNGSLIDFLNKFSTLEISAAATKRFLDYDWSLNAK